MLKFELVQTDKHSTNDLLVGKISDFYVAQIMLKLVAINLKIRFLIKKFFKIIIYSADKFQILYYLTREKINRLDLSKIVELKT